MLDKKSAFTIKSIKSFVSGIEDPDDLSSTVDTKRQDIEAK